MVLEVLRRVVGALGPECVVVLARRNGVHLAAGGVGARAEDLAKSEGCEHPGHLDLVEETLVLVRKTLFWQWKTLFRQRNTFVPEAEGSRWSLHFWPQLVQMLEAGLALGCDRGCARGALPG
eukprot:10556526-Heterocapsa_arctica.AAC.1